MEKIDYTKIRNDVVRSEICRLMSEMLDNPDKNGIYPTSKFMWEMETYILERLETAQHDDWLTGKLVIDLDGLDDVLWIGSQGYCTKRNENKVVDPELIEDIGQAILTLLKSRDLNKGGE